MALFWTGSTHVTQGLAGLERDYDLLAEGSRIAREAALPLDFDGLCEAVRVTSQVQLKEGTQELPDFGAKASKYCGSGHGGYAVYLFDERPDRKELLAIEPYMKQFMQ